MSVRSRSPLALAALLFATPALAQRDTVPAEAEALWEAGNRDAALKLVEPLLARCLPRAKRDECLDLILFKAKQLILGPRANEAVPLLRTAIDLADRYAEPDSEQGIQARSGLVLIFTLGGNPRDALPLSEQLLPAIRRRYGATSEKTRVFIDLHGRLLGMLDRFDEAEAVVDALIVDLRAAGKADAVLDALLSRAAIRATDLKRQEQAVREVLASPEFAASSNAELKIKIYDKLSQILLFQGDPTGAAEASYRVLDIARAAGVENSAVTFARERVSSVASRRGAPTLADQRKSCADLRTVGSPGTELEFAL